MHTYTPSRMQIKIYWPLLVPYSYISFYRKIPEERRTFVIFFFLAISLIFYYLGITNFNYLFVEKDN